MDETHPAHETLQTEILDKLINEKDTFRPYFPSESRYCETLLYVADRDFILSKWRLDNDTAELLSELEPKIQQIKQTQIEIKDSALELFSEEQKNAKILEIKDYLLSLYSK